ncbi:Flagellar basal-body rod protein FlgC [Pseudovibrio sp. W64]|jgi:flagellar basal-body rod protein FlgC|uniref:Flagellar basal-body rod protein FlgC n=2 Tax=Pseudovibrio TaxID=258255 RepID=A0A1I4CD32_9HYPH|nr:MULTISPECIES: flagellar basal body rod protein FlgC [Pseudovibrio]KZK77646.1 Flagellar basal-body rod protein FlgC [Pseudovibrio sp. Ad46]KZK81374.1 Flagellar basal-body rod protein FlgC [Pseudovibrio sp. Ad13]KZK83818.1 Flagellar basal-body rod protein FlgC [Pseudovibrio sp. W64]KZK93173.1 Flagellar basal-body rod protein FlgC [Pseudovibrio sp. W74]KZK93517.1 Flagellar basal-body rod protein FlgC [Pseudovibrio sp. Ad5]
MDFIKSMFIAASGLKAQTGRMRVIAENIANADSTGQTPGEDPYRRKVPTFTNSFDSKVEAELVKLGKVREDQSEFKLRYEPDHPAANDKGYVKMPNVSTLVEMADMQEATRSYEANLNVVKSSRSMMQKTLDILRG